MNTNDASIAKAIHRPQNEPIMIWEFHRAPESLRALSEHCGDEDYLAVVPPRFFQGWGSPPAWLEYGEFGCAGIDKHDHPTKPGYKVFIGAHA